MSEANHTGPEVSTRSLIIGTILAFFLNLACPYSVLVLQNAGLTSDYIAAGAMMIFLLLVGLFNPLMKVAYRPWALRSGEMVVIYVMMIVASAIPTWGLVTNLFHILDAPFLLRHAREPLGRTHAATYSRLDRSTRSRRCPLFL